MMPQTVYESTLSTASVRCLSRDRGALLQSASPKSLIWSSLYDPRSVQ